MTICIGLIPNKKSVMLIQDSEISYRSLGFTQDIFNKIRDIDNTALVGVLGNPLIANEIIELARKGDYETSKGLRDAVEAAYHTVREDKLRKDALLKYGFRDLRDVTQPHKDVQIDPSVREAVLRAANDYDGGLMGVELVLASNIEEPQLYRVTFPGVGALQNCAKMYIVSGSGTIMAIDKMGEELEKHRWKPELTDDEGIDILLRAGKAAEKHTGVGGPFEIKYITKAEDGKTRIVTPDQRKINMVMYLFPLGVKQKVMSGCIARLRSPDVTSEQLAEHIRKNVRVGIEFDRYFGLE
ncbi:hypothetical protein HZB90_00495 [archaeon]|nr:hypothetical protein [archaeon]